MTPNYSTPFSQKVEMESDKEQMSKKTHEKNISELSVIQKQSNDASTINPDMPPEEKPSEAEQK